MKNITRYVCRACVLPLLMGVPALADTSSSSAQPASSAYIPSTDWYTSISGDVTWFNSDSGGGGNIAIGHSLLPSNVGEFRAEASFGYDTVSRSHYYTYMGNLYYDFDGFGSDSLRISPYIGAGLGDATAHLGQEDSFGRYNEHGDVFAYQYMAGLSFLPSSTPNAVWSIGYRRLDTNRLDGQDAAGIPTSDRIRADNLELTARFNF